MNYLLKRAVDGMFQVFKKIAIAFLALGLFFTGVGVTYAVATSFTTTETRSETRSFKLYGLNCSDCYRRIEQKVSKLKGVKFVRVNDYTKVMTIVGSGYSMKAVHRIVRSEKQRIVR